MTTWFDHPTPFTGWGGKRGCYASDLDQYAVVASTSNNEVIATSSDAVTWTGSPSVFDSASCYDIVRCLSLGLYVAVGASGAGDFVMTSPDGIIWTGQGNPFEGAGGDSGLSVAVKETGPVFMAGGSLFDQPLAVSSDGTSWFTLTSPFDAVTEVNSVQGIAYSPTEDRWIAVGNDTDGAAMVAYTDDDGSTWTTVTQPLDYGVVDVYRDEDAGNWYIVGAASTSEVVAVSTDNGDTWTAISTPLDGQEAFGIVSTSGVLVLVGVDSDSAATTVESADSGATWTTDTSPLDGGIAYGIFQSPTVLVQVGNNADNSITLASTVPPTSPLAPGRRVGIAFDDPPLEPDPTWTWLDDETVFPSSFVAGYDTHVGRQTLISQTETGTATVYVNDRQGLFDGNNDDSPYQGKLSGRQIILQLWNPVTEQWEPQFRGLVDNYSYDIDGSAVDANGDPINASIQIECVDVFDYLNGFGLTPGMAGQVPPPAGMEDGVWYPPTDGSVEDRFIEILTDAGIDPTMYDTAQGNVKIKGVKYDPDESALTALRDAADAELPFIANIYVNRFGQFIFRGRYSRFQPGHGGDPDAPAGVSDVDANHWDFHRWKLGDGKAIQADTTRGQFRLLSYDRNRGDLINAAMCWPQGLPAAEMPDQVYAAPTSITDYGKHDAPPMSDLLTGEYVGSGTITPTTGKKQCALYAQLLVENKKSPRYAVTRLQLKAMRPDDPRAEATWGAICGADISHIVNIAVGYPGGTGFQGTSPDDDYYIEGRALTVRPLNRQHDYVELDLEVSPAEWSMDTHGIFPAYGT